MKKMSVNSIMLRLIERFELKSLIKEYGGCESCGWCCRNERLTIFAEDVEKLGSLLKPEHIQNRNEISVSFKLPCPFITENNRCGVYNKRSKVCKTYPFLFHYPGAIGIAYDCPLGIKIGDDIIKFCNDAGIGIAGDECKTKSMKAVDKMVKDLKLNSGDGYSSKLMNAPYEVFEKFLDWRRKHKKRKE